MYLISACLCGINCRYDGKSNSLSYISELVRQGKAVPICPEVLGGLPIPRVPCEIITDSLGNKKVVNALGLDLTAEFTLGAQKTLDIAKILDIKTAILKSKSPSCGYGLIYDGSFTGKKTTGSGLTADLLSKNNISVYTEENIENMGTVNNL